MERYYMKKYHYLADFIKECLIEEYTKIEFNSYKVEEEYNRKIIFYYIKLNNNEYELKLYLDTNMSLFKLIEYAKIEVKELIVNCYK